MRSIVHLSLLLILAGGCKTSADTAADPVPSQHAIARQMDLIECARAITTNTCRAVIEQTAADGQTITYAGTDCAACNHYVKLGPPPS